MKSISEEHLNSLIKETSFWNNGKTTVCIIELNSGFQVVGTSGIVDKSNFDENIGNHFAYKNAFEKLWELEGYLLQNQLTNDSRN